MTLDLEELFARNKALFGDLRMEVDDDKSEEDDTNEPDDKSEADKASEEDKAAEDKAAAEALGGEKDWKAEYEAQKRVNRDLERRSKQKMRELEQKLATAAKPKSGEDDEKPDLEAIRKQVRDEVSAETLKDKALDKIEAKAARLFQNPEDARTFLAENVEDFIDGGKVDVDAISDALADLLKARPYLGVTQGDDKKFKGGADGGARGKASKSQLTEADVKKLAAENKHAEIEQARLDGRLNELLGIK